MINHSEKKKFLAISLLGPHLLVEMTKRRPACWQSQGSAQISGLSIRSSFLFLAKWAPLSTRAILQSI